jgi:hypothetical protein
MAGMTCFASPEILKLSDSQGNSSKIPMLFDDGFTPFDPQKRPSGAIWLTRHGLSQYIWARFDSLRLVS